MFGGYTRFWRHSLFATSLESITSIIPIGILAFKDYQMSAARHHEAYSLIVFAPLSLQDSLIR